MRLLMIFVAVLALNGCAFSNVSSYVDRASDVSPFTHLIVVASNFPLSARQQAEEIMAEKVRGAGVQATVGVDVMPPTRLDDREYISTSIASSGADGLLIIYEVNRDVNHAWIPPTVISPGYSVQTGSIRGYGSVYSLGNNGYFSGSATYSGVTTHHAPTVAGGYYVDKPKASYGAAVYDFRLGGRQVWKAEVESRGNAFADFDTLANDAAEAAVKKLEADGLLYPL